MKKLLYLFAILIIFPFNVYASNKIEKIDMQIYLNEDGSANITETWIVDGDDGTEWYKVLGGVNEDRISRYTVSMDGKPLEYKSWDIDESLSEKKGYYGINYGNEGIELCFGKSDYKRHTFVIDYVISDFILTTSDSQILYWNLIDELSDVDFEDFSIKITSYFNFADTLEVWGYGYKGYAYVQDGAIYMSNEEYSDMNDSYAVLLAKFDLGTFTNNYQVDGYSDFNEVYNMAEEGTFEYDYSRPWWVILVEMLPFLFSFLFPIITIIIVTTAAVSSGYGYRNNKKINKKNTHMFRDIPCNKDIYYADTLIHLNRFNYNDTSIMGAIILKWIKENKIKFIKDKSGIFNKETSSIDLTVCNTFDNPVEQKLYDVMYKASLDGILQPKELERWCKKNYSKFFDIFKDRREKDINDLKNTGKIYKRKNKSECKKKNIMNDQLYEDSSRLYGLKLYLEEFSSINTKEVMEVKIWDEYLMFAYLFGIADKVAKQLKNLYPEVLMQDEIDYDTLFYINYVSNRSYTAASSARAAAESYSSGGGGFSSGGGGGGSFGGGGGGSR